MDGVIVGWEGVGGALIVFVIVVDDGGGKGVSSSEGLDLGFLNNREENVQRRGFLGRESSGAGMREWRDGGGGGKEKEGEGVGDAWERGEVEGEGEERWM